ncbi:FYVE, RhoGEF and PH domain-containing protein 4-like [Leptopilina heterotoma]|uniref:FYVE, RhoGEF and PH domain-containing protein 4-like n=1 Tax=Leptopilina heterotoma TaxID=63436 RepID=UPI001CA82528|nr:FYVE, RhoGEF and PH domain-containing protein 4-like [Leptopilina heterotoma]XP_043460755.1 FYVE, RhoGEF and PH domain-containing protein 4-like [Leptopilina heterotoma]XP_043460757.1 FYVE, RhoGEF and PH domain-containing protein 4-like [Leptopilina heterotoma]
MFSSKISGSTSKFYTDLYDNEETSQSEDNKSTTTKNSHLQEQNSGASDDVNSQDSDSINSVANEQNSPKHSSYNRMSRLQSCPRFQSFLVTTSNSSICTEIRSEKISTESSFVKVSHSVLEYSSSRYKAAERSSHQFILEDYAVSESESEEESDENRSTEITTIINNQPNDLANEKLLSTTKQEHCDSKKKKAHQVAEELLATEKKYVNILHLIDQVFQFRVDQENRAHPMFPIETVQHMFSNIKSIYKFHNDFLLPQLEERMKLWETNSRIGDIMKNFAPFLKMYTEYVKNFDYAMNLINNLQGKVPRFAAIINEIQKLEECGRLTLSHHMLSPIQRLPRYELLIKDYLKNLTKDNPDYEDTKKALELVSTAANHTNEAMKKIDKFKKLLEIQESIYDSTDLVSATRELVKEGRIVKISARSGDHQERHLFLFSDILLLCSLRLIPGPIYRLRAKFLVENLEIIEGDNLETANTFYIRDDNKNVELYTHSAADKAAWLDALFETMHEIMRRKASLKTGEEKNNLVKTDDVNRCMVCETLFSVMKRRHNCRSCGIIVCSKCSNQKLLFEDNKHMRVCRLCYAALTQPLTKSPTSPVPSLLQVSASAPSVFSGYLLLKTQASKHWTRRWFSLHTDFVLYTFKSDSENMAMTATPLPGFIVIEGKELPDEDPLNSKDRIRAFKIHHSRKGYYLQASSQENKEKWVHVLKLATKAELPQDNDEKSKNSENAQDHQENSQEYS